MRSDNRSDQAPFHVAAEANFQPSKRWDEVKSAILKTHSSNPGVHYILDARSLSMLDLVAASSEELQQVPHDLWYCPEVMDGTPISVGKLYSRAPKFAISIDNHVSAFTWQCDFTFTNLTASSGKQQQPVVYVVQRTDTLALSIRDKSCEAIRANGARGRQLGGKPLSLCATLIV